MGHLGTLRRGQGPRLNEPDELEQRVIDAATEEDLERHRERARMPAGPVSGFIVDVMFGASLTDVLASRVFTGEGAWLEVLDFLERWRKQPHFAVRVRADFEHGATH